jgi:hypothetical protein
MWAANSHFGGQSVSEAIIGQRALPREALRSDSSFYLTMAVISALIVFVGFAPSFYLKSVIHAPVPPLTLLTIVHGLVFTTWMVLFITQASLIRADNIALHRQLGILGAILFGVMLSLGYSTAITAGRLGHAPPGAPPPLAFMALPLIGLAGTLILIVLALLNRRHADWHKRLMIGALFTLTLPGSARIFIPLGFVPEAIWLAFALTEALVVVAIAHDWWKYKRVHPAYWIVAAVVAAMHIGVAWAFTSPTWLAFARAIT